MDGLGYFNYLVSEAEQSFFEKAAQDVAKHNSPQESTVRALLDETVPQNRTAKELAADASKKRPIKLAALVYQSNLGQMSKQASQELCSPGHINSYADLVNRIAAASPWEPLGMSKTACDYFDGLERLGIEADRVFEELINDSLSADAVIEAVMEKQAGSPLPIEQLIDELQKEAGAVSSALKGFMRMGRGAKAIGEQAYTGLKTMGQTAKGIDKAIDRGIKGVGEAAARPGKFQRMGRFLQKNVSDPVTRAGGLRNLVKSTVSKPVAKVKGAYRGMRIGGKERKLKLQAEGYNETLAKRDKLVDQMGKAEGHEAGRLGEEIKRVNAQLERQGKAGLKTEQKLEGQYGKAGIQPKAPQTSADEAARKAKKTVETAPKASGNVNPEYELEVSDRLRRGSSRSKAKPGEGQPARPRTPAEEEAYRKKVDDLKSGKGSPEAPGDSQSIGGYEPRPKAQTPPPPPGPAKEAIKEKAKESPTYGKIWEKWQDEGWASLSNAEKRKVYVAAGVAFVGQRAVMDRPII